MSTRHLRKEGSKTNAQIRAIAPNLLAACEDLCRARDRAEPYEGLIFQQALNNVEKAVDQTKKSN